MLKPIEIERILKEKVIGQDEYVRQLSVVGNLHLQKNTMVKNGQEHINTNMLIIGPSGSGKTFAIKELSKLLDIPFFEVDGSSIQANNYRGRRHAYDILSEAHDRLGKENTERAIIFIDEFDKILDLYLQKNGTGYGPQKDLLKLFEPNIETVKIHGDRFREEEITMDTSGITWICAGSFYEVLSDGSSTNVVTKSSMGFNSSIKEAQVRPMLDSDDLIRGGFMPELIGRFANIINLNTLTKDNLMAILKSGGAQMSGYKGYLSNIGVDLKLTDNFYEYLCDEVEMSNTGVRAATKILAPIFNAVLYDVLNDTSIGKATIDYKGDETLYKYSRSKKASQRRTQIEPQKSTELNYEEIVEHFMSMYNASFRLMHISSLYKIAEEVGKDEAEKEVLRKVILQGFECYHPGMKKKIRMFECHKRDIIYPIKNIRSALTLNSYRGNPIREVFSSAFLKAFPELDKAIGSLDKTFSLEPLSVVLEMIELRMKEDSAYLEETSIDSVEGQLNNKDIENNGKGGNSCQE